MMHVLLDIGHALVQANPKLTFELRNGPSLGSAKGCDVRAWLKKAKKLHICKTLYKSITGA